MDYGRNAQRSHSAKEPTRESPFFTLRRDGNVEVLTLQSADGTNRLTGDCVAGLHAALTNLAPDNRPLVITGNETFFSVGADLHEISRLKAASAYEFSRLGQALMSAVENFPAPVAAAVSGFCMGGGFDLALACHRRIAASSALFGHRGAALGLLTGWGGTQRLSRLIGKAKTLHFLTVAEQVPAEEALRLGLVEALVDDPVAEAIRQLT